MKLWDYVNWYHHHGIQDRLRKYPNEKNSAELDVMFKSIHDLEKEIAVLQKQSAKTYDLLEQGIYSEEVFLERNQTLGSAISEKNAALDSLKQKYNEQKQNTTIILDFVPQVENLINYYDTLTNAQDKNEMLKKVIDHVEYQKDKPAKKNRLEDAVFSISVFPRVP